MSEFKSIETQEELDRIIQDRLSRQKESIEKQYADYETLKAEKQELETKAAALQATIEETSTSAKVHEQTLADLNGFQSTHSCRVRLLILCGSYPISTLHKRNSEDILYIIQINNPFLARLTRLFMLNTGSLQ